MKKIIIYLTKEEIQHLKQNFDCASDCCGCFHGILNKVRKRIK